MMPISLSKLHLLPSYRVVRGYTSTSTGGTMNLADARHFAADRRSGGAATAADPAMALFHTHTPTACSYCLNPDLNDQDDENEREKREKREKRETEMAIGMATAIETETAIETSPGLRIPDDLCAHAVHHC